jgi:DNA repair exonuclease SbcCD ATPase subunit
MTQENLLAENAELKRKLAEAAENACPCSGGGHTLTKCPYFRAEAAEREINEKHARLVEVADSKRAAEREIAGYKHMLSMAHEQRDINRDRAEQAERKCAELSEALRALYSVQTAETCSDSLAIKVRAALASQPAPEGRP